MFSGDEKLFSDWEFKLQTFVRPLKQFEAYLDWVKERDSEITVVEWKAMKDSVDLAHGAGNIKLDWYDDQLYSVLSLLCTDGALASVKKCTRRLGHAARRSAVVVVESVLYPMQLSRIL